MRQPPFGPTPPAPNALLPLLPWLLALGSCSSPPRPPAVDESTRRPANSAMAVELQVCKSDLQATRQLATESVRTAQASAITLDHLASRQQAIAARLAGGPPAWANTVYTVRFDFGSTRVAVPPDTAPALIEQTRAAPLILLRGRTDGLTDSPADSRIARDRAAAVRDYLVAAGIDPARIRATHQPSGDHVAANGNPAGRSLNRRVEIEVYRVLPMASTASSMAMDPPPAEHHASTEP